MKNGHSAVLACVGAVIGAGFASGREVVVFFTQYGRHGWWLIVLAALVMTVLCALCMQTARSGYAEWVNMVQGGWLAQSCPLILMTLTAGAMVSASGHMIALLWSHPWAYAMGALGTLLAAWRMGYGSLKPLNAISAVLSLAMLCALMMALVRMPQETVELSMPAGFAALAGAAVRAMGYAAMNIMLAIGVVCRSAEHSKNVWITAGLFGWMIGMLLLISQCVYSRYTGAVSTAFPMIVLLAEYGRTGYLFGVVLLYLAIVTTLTSVLYALRMAVESHAKRQDMRLLLTLGLPLAVSGIGFESIVDRFYAPAGLICLAAVFLPLAVRYRNRTKQLFLDNSG